MRGPVHVSLPAFVGITIAALAASASADELTLDCASPAEDRTICELPGNANDVRLIDGGNGACAHGDTWGVSSGQLWVRNGCGGAFRVFTRDSRAPREDISVVGCGSDQYTYTVCPIDRTAYSAEVARRLSDADCLLEDSWGVERGRLWVDKGCSAEFEIAFSPVPGALRAVVIDQGPLADLADKLRAVRACRRYGEDNPRRMNGRWADAGAPPSFDVDKRGDRFAVEGAFNVIGRNAGPDAAARSVFVRCTVADDVVQTFTVD